MVIRLRDDQSCDRITARTRDLPLHQNVETGSGTHLTSYSVSTVVLYWQLSGRGVKLTDHLHLMSRLRMSRGKPPILLHAFVVKWCFILISPLRLTREQKHLTSGFF